MQGPPPSSRELDADADGLASSAVAPRDSSVRPLDAFAPPLVLVVDDQEANLVAAEAVLAPLGCSIVKARSGPEALERVAEDDFALLLVDVHMPELDGYQTVERMRLLDRARDVPVVFLTAIFDDPAHLHRGYELGALDYVTKPVDPTVLRGKVQALLQMYRRATLAEQRRRRAAERTKDLFLGAIGHDLRNPLNAIAMASQLVLRDAEQGRPAHVAVARRLEHASLRMKDMIEDILDLTRAQFVGDLALVCRETDLGEVCRSVVEEARLAHPRREVSLALTGDLVGAWDAGRVARVVSNLLGNAIDHGEGAPVGVRLVGSDDGVTVEVRNGGRPIAPEALATIFDPFRRGSASAGLGLGLHIVREIVRAHGGTVEVTSSAAGGTAFTVTLPRGTAPRAGAGGAPPICAA